MEPFSLSQSQEAKTIFSTSQTRLTAQWDPLTNPALSQNLLLNRSSCDSLALTESAVSSRWVCDSLLRKNGGSCGLYKGLVGYECKKLKDRWKTIWRGFSFSTICHVETLRIQFTFAIAWSNLVGIFVELGNFNRALQ
ncbi:putative UDP-N-acetylglucosamine--peptide N-acetylglucosaminyltransferase SEC [Trifolium repens]|nr:putative UDP-N-acetylglucosamine--peptide N-acetylglucosaminyltransferase SEC [Trifolium repens]